MWACNQKMFYLVFFITTVFASSVIYYDNFSGNNLTSREYQQAVKENLTFWCTGAYKPCDASEGRRPDGTCNNLMYPSRGAPRTPSYRELPAQFGKDNAPVKTKRGEEMPSARKVRMESLIDGNIPDDNFTSMTPHYLLFMNPASFHDSANYVRWTTTCCQPDGVKNPMCAPIRVPEDDTIHQFSGIRCLNLTKPLTYQNLGCTRNAGSTPERINSATSFLDLHQLYGYNNEYRAMKDGLLQVDNIDGSVWPVSTDHPQSICLQNAYPRERQCHKSPDINLLIGMNFFSIFFWRLHNYIACQLKMVNPSWDDDKLFSFAKDINLAIALQIYYYDLMPDLMGKSNLIKDGVISPDGGFRDVYDKHLMPQSSNDFLYALRWAHTIQPGMLKLYDGDGIYLKQVASVNLTLRTGYLAVDNNMDGLTQGAFRQPMARIDHVVDPLLSQKGFGAIQKAFDITAADLQKGGLMGIPSYIKYRELCTGRKYTSFSDLAEDMDQVNIEVIKKTQKDVEDIPLLLGIWMEKNIPGGFLPRTLYCLAARQMKKFAQYDRHWYERPNRPMAFTKEQLGEIRKASMAWVFCAVGGSVTEIQPKAFLREGPYNRMASCRNIVGVNFEAWKEINMSQ